MYIYMLCTYSHFLPSYLFFLFSPSLISILPPPPPSSFISLSLLSLPLYPDFRRHWYLTTTSRLSVLVLASPPPPPSPSPPGRPQPSTLTTSSPRGSPWPRSSPSLAAVRARPQALPQSHPLWYELMRT